MSESDGEVIGIALSLVGTALSIYSAIFSWQQSRKAKKAVEIVEGVKNEILHHHDISDVSRVYVETKRVRMRLGLIGPTSSTKSLRGTSLRSILNELDDYLLVLSEYKNLIVKNCPDFEFDTFFKDIERLAEELSGLGDKDFDNIKRVGTSLTSLVTQFLSISKDLSDKKIILVEEV